ncbi:hypothetical protein B0H19DRAFT_1060903 [Mycena capillaripes]|nr:hypothetical protein B0H19DRAFT_1060903 [Mycena capillaripes]
MQRGILRVPHTRLCWCLDKVHMVHPPSNPSSHQTCLPRVWWSQCKHMGASCVAQVGKRVGPTHKGLNVQRRYGEKTREISMQEDYDYCTMRACFQANDKTSLRPLDSQEDLEKYAHLESQVAHPSNFWHGSKHRYSQQEYMPKMSPQMPAQRGVQREVAVFFFRVVSQLPGVQERERERGRFQHKKLRPYAGHTRWSTKLLYHTAMLSDVVREEQRLDVLEMFHVGRVGPAVLLARQNIEDHIDWMYWEGRKDERVQTRDVEVRKASRMVRSPRASRHGNADAQAQRDINEQKKREVEVHLDGTNDKILRGGIDRSFVHVIESSARQSTGGPAPQVNLDLDAVPAPGNQAASPNHPLHNLVAKDVNLTAMSAAVSFSTSFLVNFLAQDFMYIPQVSKTNNARTPPLGSSQTDIFLSGVQACIAFPVAITPEHIFYCPKCWLVAPKSVPKWEVRIERSILQAEAGKVVPYQGMPLLGNAANLAFNHLAPYYRKSPDQIRLEDVSYSIDANNLKNFVCKMDLLSDRLVKYVIFPAVPFVNRGELYDKVSTDSHCSSS